MTESENPTSLGRKRWELDRGALDALLRALGPEREVAGRRYEELRRKLINLFAWEQCEAPDDLADEVLNRLARKVTEGAAISHIDRFAFGIARLMLQEETRNRRNRQAVLRELRTGDPASASGGRSLEAMERCLSGLSKDRRELIERYYVENRVALARELGISVNALRNRALRIREELFNCVSRQRDDS